MLITAILKDLFTYLFIVKSTTIKWIAICNDAI